MARSARAGVPDLHPKCEKYQGAASEPALSEVEGCRKSRKIGLGFTAAVKLDSEGGGGFNPRITPANIEIGFSRGGILFLQFPPNPQIFPTPLRPPGRLPHNFSPF